MTTLTTLKVKKCQCEKAHSMLDVLVANDSNGQVEYRQKWHKCSICSRVQHSKWIRLHEMRCYYAHKK